MLYYEEIDGRDVWVSVDSPLVPAGDGQYAPGGFWVAAFRLNEPPGVIIGEYVKNTDQRTTRFPTPESAYAAGFNEARKRLRAKG